MRPEHRPFRPRGTSSRRPNPVDREREATVAEFARPPNNVYGQLQVQARPLLRPALVRPARGRHLGLQRPASRHELQRADLTLTKSVTRRPRPAAARARRRRRTSQLAGRADVQEALAARPRDAGEGVGGRPRGNLQRGRSRAGGRGPPPTATSRAVNVVDGARRSAGSIVSRAARRGARDSRLRERARPEESPRARRRSARHGRAQSWKACCHPSRIAPRTRTNSDAPRSDRSCSPLPSDRGEVVLLAVTPRSAIDSSTTMSTSVSSWRRSGRSPSSPRLPSCRAARS